MANKSKTKVKTVSMTISIPKGVHRAARLACVATGKTLAQAVTEALDAWAFSQAKRAS